MRLMLMMVLVLMPLQLHSRTSAVTEECSAGHRFGTDGCKDRLSLLWGLTCMFGNSEANTFFLPVIHCVELLQERNAEDEERPVRWGYVKAHQGHLAIRIGLVDIILRFQVENVITDHKPKLRQAVEVRTV